ncbi:MAG: hypothetical protein ACK5JD_15920 [Mangrovibacterium sp.]
MKKITRKNLKQLSETMTILSEAEQRSCVGAEHYYDMYGNYLGTVGSSSEVRTMDYWAYDALKNSSSATYMLHQYSTSLFDSGIYAQNNIINTIAYELGIYEQIYVYSFFYDDGTINRESGGATRYTSNNNWTDYNSYMALNSASYTLENGNIYDIMCMLIHEKDHYDNYNPSTYDKTESEYLAYLSTINSEYFQYTSADFKEGVYSQYYYYDNLYYNQQY